MENCPATNRIRCAVLVFLKYPAPGKAKTRLGAAIGLDAAAQLYHTWIRIVLQKLQPARKQTRLVAFFTGAPAEAFREWEELVDEWVEQPGGSLGDKLAAGFESLSQIYDRVLAIGTDCLEIDTDVVQQAFDSLNDEDAVFGPTPDGGYYLIGLKRHHPGIFDDVRWSSPQTLADQLENCRANQLSVAILSQRSDIDTWDDWQDHCRRHGIQGTHP